MLIAGLTLYKGDVLFSKKTLGILAVLGVSVASAAVVIISNQTNVRVVSASTPFEVNVNASHPSANPAVRLTVFRSGLSTPWGMAFLPDARVLVTQKGGSLVLLSADGSSSSTISGVPSVDSSGQGGLLDVVIDPQFSSNKRIYLTFSESGTGGNGTAVYRAELNSAATALQNGSVIFRQPKKSGTSNHYGSRLIFRRDGTLFVTVGERAAYPNEAQSLTTNLGKVLRINTDGTPVSDNPFFSQGGNAAYVWSYGHRNPQGAVLNPTTGDLWVAEHGPQGGDEINISLPGKNFGWPNVSYGCDYGDPVGTDCRYGGGVHKPPYTPPLVFWYPVSTAPGAIAFYTGDKIPEWQGNVFVGGLGGATLWRFVLNGSTVTSYQAIFPGQQEIRQLMMGPDGYMYLISRSSNQIFRIQK